MFHFGLGERVVVDKKKLTFSCYEDHLTELLLLG